MMSLPEVLLWRELRTRPSGFKFRRQHPAGPYVIDFYCDAARLAIELDGEAHERGDQPLRDTRRDVWLEAVGVQTLRIPARDVMENMDAVVRLIVAAAGLRRGPHHQPAAGPPPPVGED
ncbi:endonuclease domain-containing protein [Sphingomonas sp. GlSt437]|uniref:endonuclease domain-containing protein n=1 Tax=Sphingomonas sp. GlSt437 TaxID=3389970 RepID=UPI003A8451CE